MSFAEQIRQRSRGLALDIIRFCRRLPRTLDSDVVAKQLIRAGTGTAANYRAACRSRSPNEFVSRISVACEEADETEFWLGIARDAAIGPRAECEGLLKEASERVAILTRSRDTAKRNAANPRSSADR